MSSHSSSRRTALEPSPATLCRQGPITAVPHHPNGGPSGAGMNWKTRLVAAGGLLWSLLGANPITPTSSPVGEAAGETPVAPAARAVTEPLPASGLPAAAPGRERDGEGEYRIGTDDEVEISVYGDSDLKKTQIVRPGGNVSFPLIGDIKAAGLTPNELREQIAHRLTAYVNNPRVTIIVTDYGSRRVSLLGEVKNPSVLKLSGAIDLLEALSRVGGVTEDADLQGALLLRAGQVVPVDFERLLRQGDPTQNAVLRPNDTVLIPSARDRKVFVLGQVQRPTVVALKGITNLIEAVSRAGGVTVDADLQGALLVRSGRVMPVSFEKLLAGDPSQNVPLEHNDVVLVPNVKDKKVLVLGEVNRPLVVYVTKGLNLAESIAMAGGFTSNAATKNVVLVRGGLGDPKIEKINVNDITRNGAVSANPALQAGDVVYVPRTLISNVVKVAQDVTSILAPVVMAETGIVLGPTVQAVLQGRQIITQTVAQPTVVVSPR